MGEGRHYYCKKCGYTFEADLGIGYMYPAVYHDTMESARSGRFGDAIKTFLAAHPDGVIDPQNVAVRCTECGNLELVQDLSMYLPKDPGKVSTADYVMDFRDYTLVQKYQHKCSQCGSSMTVLKGKNLNNLKCPHCGEQLSEKQIMWD